MSDLEFSDDIMFNDDPGFDDDEPLSSSSTHISPVVDIPEAEPSYQHQSNPQDSVAAGSDPQPIAASRFTDIPQKPRWMVEKQDGADALYAASAPVDIINPRRWRNTGEQAEEENNSPPPSNTFVPLHTMYRTQNEEDILGTSYGEYRPRLEYRRKMEFLKRIGLIATDAPPTPPSAIHPTTSTVHPPQAPLDSQSRVDHSSGPVATN